MQCDQGARDLLDVLFPNPSDHQDVSPGIEEDGPEELVPGFLSRTWSPVREGFWRLIRG
jgi:hypothetical protein